MASSLPLNPVVLQLSWHRGLSCTDGVIHWSIRSIRLMPGAPGGLGLCLAKPLTEAKPLLEKPLGAQQAQKNESPLSLHIRSSATVAVLLRHRHIQPLFVQAFELGTVRWINEWIHLWRGCGDTSGWPPVLDWWWLLFCYLKVGQEQDSWGGSDEGDFRTCFIAFSGLW